MVNANPLESREKFFAGPIEARRQKLPVEGQVLPPQNGLSAQKRAKISNR
jgi:hypothetical protein